MRKSDSSALLGNLPPASEELSQSNSSDPENRNQPSKRWGHTSVEALNRMFIIGGYQGKYQQQRLYFGF